MRLAYSGCVLACALLVGCSSGGSGGGESGGTRELTLGRTASDTIGAVGNVDWYHFRAVEANNVLQVRCTSNTYRPDVDLLVTVYEADASGNKTRIYGDHARDGSQLPADLTLNLYIDRPKDLYISVRDLLDDESSPQPYYLSLDYIGAADEDGNFANALALPVDDAQTPLTGTIGYVGDIDCYRFDAATDGVYAVDVDFTPYQGGTDVALSVRLYDDQGALVAAHPGGFRTRYALLPYLTAGTYYVTVEDAGRDDYDLSSFYAISASHVPVDEARENDLPAAATALTFDAGAQEYRATGSLAYTGDRDWYAVPGQSVAGLEVLEVRFADQDAPDGSRFALTLSDETGRVLLSHEYVAGSSEYVTQVLAGQGTHLLQVAPAAGVLVDAAAPYHVAVKVISVDDPGEAGAGNGTPTTAELLPPDGSWVDGKIAFRGDVDWYRVDADTAAPRVLEVFLETDAAGPVEYALSVILGGEVVQKVYDSFGGDGPTHLKASVFVPQGSPAGPASYFFRVTDYQGDEGDNGAPYRLRARVVDVPVSLPTPPDPKVVSAVYASEADESGPTLRVDVSSLVKREYAANTATLDPGGPGAVLGSVNGLTTITLPWVGGYVDYQGDQDWFELNLGPLNPADTAWYYDIQVELYSPGSEVEYIWKLFRDVDQDRDLVDRPNDSDGFFGSAGDPSTAVDGVDFVTPGAGEQFWVGDAWAGKFYLSVGDFDFVNAALPDEDWGYDAPYYFRVILTYHPGVSYP
jgi:hypothetical protein